MTGSQSICVIIAAKDASPFIARAVRSALAEPETSEVVVIDDGSSDHTGEAAMSADDESGRLRVLRFDDNRGPAAARNHAIANSSAPLIAVLDADDFFLPGRFERLLALPDWDFVADNIVFVEEGKVPVAALDVAQFEPASVLIGLDRFIEGNISRRGKSRGELGFLKPVMRREFLAAHGLHYKEDLRLGEDYDVYVRALAAGARFRLSHACGYGAVVRPGSLSGHHRTEDLRRLYEADRSILRAGGLQPGAAALIRQHERHIRGRYELRHFLDVKKAKGAGAALGYALSHPAALPAIALGIAADKAERFRSPPVVATESYGGAAGLRYLLPATPVSAQR